jgi:hypothetical protein
MSKINLKKITAITIDGRRFDEERYTRFKDIVSFMSEKIEFHSIKMFLVQDPEIPGVEFYRIKNFGISDYSRFCLHNLYDNVDSDYCLIFQDDGFVLNPHLWDDEFLKYDYIGSPWPLYIGWPEEGRQVGNGGFSLRSKKLLEYSKSLTSHSTENEDTYLLNSNRENLVKFGINIAPLDIARKFSVENPLDDDHNLDTCFGFHAKHLLNDAIKKIKGTI